MEEKYIGKVKVPFCVDVSAFTQEDRNKLRSIYSELGYSVRHIAVNDHYDGLREDGWNTCGNLVSKFGENTTVYTLEQLQAIIDSVGTHQPEVVSSEHVKWGDWQEGDEVIFCGFTNELHNHWSFTVGETYTVKEEDGFIAPMSDNGCVPTENWGFNFKKKSVETDSDGWIPWSGGKMPIPKGTLIDVEHRNGEIFQHCPAGYGYCDTWTHYNCKGDIVAYRIVGEYLTPHPVVCSDDTATLDEDEYVGIASGETGSTDSVGSFVKVTANISFDIAIKGQTFTFSPDELQELYVQLCVAEGQLQDWSLGQ